MSKISLQPNASGTGTFTLAAPDSNTNRTLTLPDEAGVVLTDGSDIAAANLTGRVLAANAPLGSVIQVAQHKTTARSVLSASGSSTISSSSGAQYTSFSFTPKFTTSKLLLLSSTFLVGEVSNSSDALYAAAFHDTTLIGSVLNYSSFPHWANNLDTTFVSFNHLFDSWGTTAQNISIRVGGISTVGIAVNFPNAATQSAGQYDSPNQHEVTFTVLEISA